MSCPVPRNLPAEWPPSRRSTPIWSWRRTPARGEVGLPAYGWGAELSIYLRPDAAGKGLGRRLYRVLIQLLRLQGVHTVYGLVASPNPASEGLHAALGFRVMGVQRKAGYKNGRWIDLLWFERAIASYDPDPAPLIPVSNLPQEAVRAALNSF